MICSPDNPVFRLTMLISYLTTALSVQFVPGGASYSGSRTHAIIRTMILRNVRLNFNGTMKKNIKYLKFRTQSGPFLWRQ